MSLGGVNMDGVAAGRRLLSHGDRPTSLAAVREVQRRSRAAAGDGFVDAYSVGFSLLVLMGWPLTVLVAEIRRLAGSGGALACAECVLRIDVLTLTGSFLLHCIVLRLLLALGPAALPLASVQWLLPLPVDRRRVLLPRLAFLAAATAAGLALLDVLVALSLRPVLDPVLLLQAAVTGGATGLAVVAGAVVVQSWGGARPRQVRTATAVLMGGVVSAVVLALVVGVEQAQVAAALGLAGPWGWSTGAVGSPTAVVGLTVASVIAVVLVARAVTRLGAVGVGAVAEASGAVEGMVGAAYSIDLRAVGAAATSLTARPAGHRRSRLPAGHGATALLRAGVVSVQRDRHRLTARATTVAVPAVVLAAGGADAGVVVAVNLLTGAYLVASAAADPLHEDGPEGVLTQDLPLRAVSVVAALAVVPVLVTCLWAALALGLAAGGPP